MPITFNQVNFPYRHWQFLNTDSGDRIRLVPERGGLITEWLCNGREILYFDQERFSDVSNSVRGGIPILFPICGDLSDDTIPFSNTFQKLKQHGFARDLPWQIRLLESKDGVCLTCSDNNFTRSSFPFSFLIEMEVRLLSGSLEITIKISNLSKSEMPFAFGLHPYFKVEDLSAVRLQGLEESCFSHLEMMRVETSSQISDLTKGVDFLVSPKGKVILIDDVSNSRIQLEAEYPMDLIVIWTDPPRSMVCLEPWTSPRNSLINGQRRLVLPAGEKMELGCRYLSF